jgi:hypothetical protein
MTRNWIATASRALGIVSGNSARPSRRQCASLGLENLEYRLSLSAVSAGGSVPLIKHGAVPTSVQVQPMTQGQHIGTNIVGQHIGTNIVGQHIGTG